MTTGCDPTPVRPTAADPPAVAAASQTSIQADPLEATEISNEVTRLLEEGKYPQAEPLARKALSIREAALGPKHPDTAQSLSGLALLLRLQGRYTEAEPLFRRALAIHEAALGAGHLDTAQTLNNLAVLLQAQGRYAEAEPLFRRVLAIRAVALGDEDPLIAQSLNNLAFLFQSQGRYTEAEPPFRRALATREKTLGAEHPLTAQSLNNLANLFRLQGRVAEAELPFRRALVIRESALGAEHPDTAQSLNNLGLLLQAQGRYAEADPLLRRALATREKALGAAHPFTAQSLNNLASLLRLQGRVAEAEPYYRRALAIRENAIGNEHPDTAQSRNNLALVLQARGRHAEAEQLFRRALAVREKALGAGHPDTAQSLNNLAALFRAQRRYAEAEPPFRRALAIRQKALGAEHPDTAQSLSNLAGLLRAQGHLGDAVGMSRGAVGILAARYARPETSRSGGQDAELRNRRGSFVQLVSLLADARQRGDASASLVDEAFRAAQLAGGIETANAISGMAARFAAGGDALAAVVRERQDLIERWRAMDRAMIEAVSLPADLRNAAAEAATRQALAAADARLLALDARMATEFPRYAEVANPRPTSIEEVQALLATDEALVIWTVDRLQSFLFAIRSDRAVFARIDLKAADLKEAVAVLRTGLEPPEAMASVAQAPRFDVSAAHALYRKLLEPAEALLADARHVFVVPDGALQSLPLGVLVTQPSQAPIREIGGYAEVPWLARRSALTVLPAVSSLRALRLFAAQAKGSSPFAGFGDPLFQGAPDSTRKVRLATLFRGVTADVAQVRELARLPDTAAELRAQARALNAPLSAVRLGAQANEIEVKRTDLSGVRVLSFATHGLVAGDLEGLAEPALALTPPATATAEDDGLLTASEVAQLKLNADWVVLSACNTAAADGSEGAEGLSGLAKAFFYAGARALLVSHWPVETSATVEITTGAFRELERASAIGRSEALRRSMLALIDQAKAGPKTAHLAHPMFWAPFVLVGEGAAGR